MSQHKDFPRLQTSHAILKPTADSGQSQLSELNSALRSNNRLHRALVSPTVGLRKSVDSSGTSPPRQVSRGVGILQQVKPVQSNGGANTFHVVNTVDQRPPTRQVAAFPRNLDSLGTSPPPDSTRDPQRRKVMLQRSNSFGNNGGLALVLGAARREYKGGNVMARGGQPLKPRSLKTLQAGYRQKPTQVFGGGLVGDLARAIVGRSKMKKLSKDKEKSQPPPQHQRSLQPQQQQPLKTGQPLLQSTVSAPQPSRDNPRARGSPHTMRRSSTEAKESKNGGFARASETKHDSGTSQDSADAPKTPSDLIHQLRREASKSSRPPSRNRASRYGFRDQNDGENNASPESSTPRHAAEGSVRPAQGDGRLRIHVAHEADDLTVDNTFSAPSSPAVLNHFPMGSGRNDIRPHDLDDQFARSTDEGESWSSEEGEAPKHTPKKVFTFEMGGDADDSDLLEASRDEGIGMVVTDSPPPVRHRDRQRRKSDSAIADSCLDNDFLSLFANGGSI